MRSPTYDEFFRVAGGPAGPSPFPFQRTFGEAPDLPSLVRVPTGLGKTAMVVVGWLWRRFGDHEVLKAATPRRLVYCLPMRVLVEQTARSAREWIGHLKAVNQLGTGGPDVHVLMGGEDEDQWDIHPEREAILVGTQDMLLSRALNRGYAVTRSRWPIQFGLLNTDCLWVFDEIQLMGTGLATTTQLEALRRLLPSTDSEQANNGHSCHSVWMSATMQRDWLGTVDFAPFLREATELVFDFQSEAGTPGLEGAARKALSERWTASKPLRTARATMGDAQKLAEEIVDSHVPGTRTIVVVNTVRRARKIHDQIAKRWRSEDGARLVLLHSRFRPGDREIALNQALAEPAAKGSIVVSTQVIEAGVDVSATTLFTELAPWASLVQRFGRCNRRGEDKNAQVFWIDLRAGSTEPQKIAFPYTIDELRSSAEQLKKLTDVALKSLPDIPLQFEHSHVIRKRDLIDLFDTTPDLAGSDIEIDRFVREIEESDVRLFWREYGETPNAVGQKNVEPAAQRYELCPAPVSEFRIFASDPKRRGALWRWDFLYKCWEKADPNRIVPGWVYLLHSNLGGYLAARGWEPESSSRVEPVALEIQSVSPPDSTDDDPTSRIHAWQTIAEHTDEVCRELNGMLGALPFSERDIGALRTAGRWHDWGKAHAVFQNAIDDGQIVERKRKTVSRRERPDQWKGCRYIAKAPDKVWKDGRVVQSGWWRPYDWPEQGRKYFRHELASALAVLNPQNRQISDDLRDLVAYLIAAHHGKVRLSIRSLPNETRPRDKKGNLQLGRRFARAIWDRDELPSTELGGGIVASAVTLSLEPMELGLCEEEPFIGQSSWSERMIRLRDEIGPFRLAYLEAIIRAADMRASKKAGVS